MIQCPRCHGENPPQAKFCLECATPLALRCSSCGTQLPRAAKFCFECAQPVSRATTPLASRFSAPDAYTPRHLADRILTSKAALEGERKQVTVLFADVKSSMELLADRDPEEARKLLDPVLERMIDGVHRYEGTVNQVMGDGIMALFGAPLAHEDHAVRACYAALRMHEAVGRHAEELRRTQGLDVQIRVGLNSELGMLPLLAHCHLGLGTVYGRMDRRQQAVGHLATASRMYGEMDMRSWQQRAGAELATMQSGSRDRA